MNSKERRRAGRGAIELVEETTQLMRVLPAGTFLVYYVGSIPFVLGFLYFWSDMSRNAFAYKHVAQAALYVAASFIWMKCWQSVFAVMVRAHISERTREKWTFGRVIRLVTAQVFVQPSGLIVLPAALIAVLPFGWAYAFYQNFSLFGNGEPNAVKTSVDKAWMQAKLFPRQNHVVLFMLSAFGCFVFLDLAIVIYIAPHLLNTLLGIETIFVMAPWSMLNTTFPAVTCGLVYLLLDPLVKTLYVLRCFYGGALDTGEDLMAELKYLVAEGRKTI